jgi:hypothetical protein
MKILYLVLLVSFIGLAYSDVLLDLDNDGYADAVLIERPANSIDWNRDGVVDWKDDWAVRGGRRGGHDWNRDGIIDWKDDFIAGGVQPWNGDWVRADWNRDGVVDWQDGWRRMDNTWTTGSWDPNWRGEGWRPETVSVREVDAIGSWNDSQWQTIDGPWDSYGWGGSWVGDWNNDGVVDWKDDWAWRDGMEARRGESKFVREVPTPGYGQGVSNRKNTSTKSSGTKSKSGSTVKPSTKTTSKTAGRR